MTWSHSVPIREAEKGTTGKTSDSFESNTSTIHPSASLLSSLRSPIIPPTSHIAQRSNCT